MAVPCRHLITERQRSLISWGLSFTIHAAAVGMLFAASIRLLEQPMATFAGHMQIVSMQSEQSTARPMDLAVESDSTVRAADTPEVGMQILAQQITIRQFREHQQNSQERVSQHELGEADDRLGPNPMVTKVLRLDGPMIPIATADRPAKPIRTESVTKPVSAVSVKMLPQDLGTESILPPDFANNRPPQYPAAAVARRWEGIVLLRLEIDESGRVTAVDLQSSSGYPLLDEAAVAAIREWRAKPAMRNGRPAATVEFLPVRFRL